MSFVGIIVVGLPITIGIAWQFMLFSRDFNNKKTPTRIKFSLFICAVLIFGIFAYSTFTILDEQQTVDLWFAIGAFFKACVLGFMFLIASWLGPLYIGVLAAWGAYNVYVGSDFSHIPVLTFLVNWAFESAQAGVAIAYVVLSSAIVVLLSGKDSIPDRR